MYALALFGTGTVLLGLWPVKRIVSHFGLRNGSMYLEVELDAGARIADVIGAVESQGRRVISASVAGNPDARLLSLVVSSSDDHGVLDSVARLPLVRRARAA